jgi:predicted phosphate transport protein (TIGR00153 family)
LTKLSLLPRDKKFSVLLDQSTANVAGAARQLKDMVDIWENVKERVGIIDDMEHEGDAIKHLVMAELRRSMIVPFDREDIALLAHSLDEITDFIHSAADAMLVYDIERPTEKMKELVHILLEAATAVTNAAKGIFERLEKDEMVKRRVEVHRLENLGDTAYRDALVQLFETSTDVRYIVKWRDIYKYVEAAIDRCEDVANQLEDMALKYG